MKETINVLIGLGKRDQSSGGEVIVIQRFYTGLLY